MSVVHLNTENYSFKFEPFLRQEYSFSLDPDRPVCEFYNPREGPNSCPNGASCPNKHVLPIFHNKIVCKHWLRGLCKKNDPLPKGNTDKAASDLEHKLKADLHVLEQRTEEAIKRLVRKRIVTESTDEG